MTEQAGTQKEKPFVIPFALAGAGEDDPFLTFKFWVEKDNVVLGGFQECSGLRLERAVETIEEGGVNDHVHVLPGRVQSSNITLKHGIIASDALWNWFSEGLQDGKVECAALSLVMIDLTGKQTKRWDLTGGFPNKWEGPALNVEQSQIAVETLEIAFQGTSSAESGTTSSGGGRSEEEAEHEELAYRVLRLLKEDAWVERERLGSRR